MKRSSKIRPQPAGELCPMCGKGTTHIKRIDYTLKDQNGKAFVVPDIDVEICDFCGEHIFNMEAVRKAEQIQGRAGKIVIHWSGKFPKLETFRDQARFHPHSTLSF